MQKKTSSTSSGSSKGYLRNRNSFEQLFSSGSEKQKPKKAKTLELSIQLSTSINKKTDDAIKITHQNFREVLLSLAHRILTANQKGKAFLQTVAAYLKQDDPELDQQVHTMLIDIDYKKDTFDLLTPLKTIETQIIKSTLKKDNPVGRIAFELWYYYLYNKYNVDTFQNFRKHWVIDINVFKEYFANIIYQVYGEWVFLIEKKKDMFPYIWKEFTPFILTAHPGFEKVYKIALRHLGEEPLKLDPSKTPQYFAIRPQFSCQDEQSPFEKTIQVISEICKQWGIKKKILKIKELAVTLKQELRNYQDYRIGKNLQETYKDIDCDNMLGCFSYSILKSNCGGVPEALDYLELFFMDDQKYGQQGYIQALKIDHIITTLRAAGLYLRNQCTDAT